MAFMTIDAYRILHKVSGRGWSMEQESLYQKIVKGETIDPNTVKQFFPIYKLHLFGSIKISIYQQLLCINLLLVL